MYITYFFVAEMLQTHHERPVIPSRGGQAALRQMLTHPTPLASRKTLLYLLLLYY